MGEYESEERKRSNEEKVLLMTSLGNVMIREGAAVPCRNEETLSVSSGSCWNKYRYQR